MVFPCRISGEVKSFEGTKNFRREEFLKCVCPFSASTTSIYTTGYHVYLTHENDRYKFTTLRDRGAVTMLHEYIGAGAQTEGKSPIPVVPGCAEESNPDPQLLKTVRHSMRPVGAMACMKKCRGRSITFLACL